MSSQLKSAQVETVLRQQVDNCSGMFIHSPEVGVKVLEGFLQLCKRLVFSVRVLFALLCDLGCRGTHNDGQLRTSSHYAPLSVSLQS